MALILRVLTWEHIQLNKNFLFKYPSLLSAPLSAAERPRISPMCLILSLRSTFDIKTSLISSSIFILDQPSRLSSPHF